MEINQQSHLTDVIRLEFYHDLLRGGRNRVLKRCDLFQITTKFQVDHTTVLRVWERAKLSST